MSDIPEKAVEAACLAYASAATKDGNTTWRLDGQLRLRIHAALAAALPHLASAQPQPSKSDEEWARQLAEELSCFHWPLRGPYPNATRLLLSAIAAARAAALDECASLARHEAGRMCNCGERIARALAALKRGPVAEESGE